MKIAIVNDLDLAVQVLRRALLQRPGYEMAWIARNGKEAVDLCVAQRPDVLLMDLIMPVMDGVEATRRIMQIAPCPILIVTSDIGAHVPMVYEAMGLGALDAVDTPSFSGGELARTAMALYAKIDRIAQQNVPPVERAVINQAPSRASAFGCTLLAIGASAGGPVALARVLQDLPPNFQAAVVIIQHVDAAFAAGMADWLSQQSGVPVRVAVNGDRPILGQVLIAATNDHLRLDAAGTLRYSSEPAQSFYRPSVDAFFFDVATVWKGTAIGLLLTGMGRDGAAGLKAMRERGFYTATQDRASSAVFGMPKAAAEIDAAVDVLPLGSIAKAVSSHF
jgi:chemotaxis response regulator CheB